MGIKGIEINGRTIDDTTLSNLPIGSSAKDLADLLSDTNIKNLKDEAKPHFALSTNMINSLHKLGILEGTGKCETCENCGECNLYKLLLPRDKGSILVEHNPKIEGYTGILSN